MSDESLESKLQSTMDVQKAFDEVDHTPVTKPLDASKLQPHQITPIHEVSLHHPAGVVHPSCLTILRSPSSIEGVSISSPSIGRMTLFDVFESQRLWALNKFGDITPQKLAERASKEFKEMVDVVEQEGWSPEALEEAADVILILTRAPGLATALVKKIEINSNRQWDILPDGTAYHKKTPTLDEEHRDDSP